MIDHLDVSSRSSGSTSGSGSDLAAAEIMALEPDHVIVATGSAPTERDRSATWPRASWTRRAWTPTTCCRSGTCSSTAAAVGRRVLIVDDGEGGWKGVGLALQLDEDGHEVEFVTPLPYVGAKLGPFSAQLAMQRLFATRIIEMHPFATLLARSRTTPLGSSSRATSAASRTSTRWSWPAGTAGHRPLLRAQGGGGCR